MSAKYNEYQKLLLEQGKNMPKKTSRSSGRGSDSKTVAPLKIRLSQRKKRKNDDSDEEASKYSELFF